MTEIDWGLEWDNHWNLYTTNKRAYHAANRALEAAWKRAAKAKTAREAYKIMEAVMTKHAAVGASDSEPYHELERRMEAERERRSRWGD
jgi:hypothetical protein